MTLIFVLQSRWQRSSYCQSARLCAPNYQDEAAKPSSWRNVRALIDTDDFSSAGTGAPPDKMAPARVALLNSKGCGPSVPGCGTTSIRENANEF